MKNISIGLLSAFLYFFLSIVTVYAQAINLKIGDKVPDITINNIINYKNRSAKISDFKGKLLILDFWSMHCTFCIKKFPTLDSLKDKFKERLEVLLVNDNIGDSEEKVQAFFERIIKTPGKKFNLPYVVSDTMLRHLFPHILIPHYAWIGPDGTLKALTSSEQITETNILQILNNKNVALDVKMDINTSKPLFLTDGIADRSLISYSILIKGQINGLGSGNIYRRKGNLLYGRAFTNSPLLGIYESIAMAMIRPYNDKLMLIEVKNFAKISTASSNIKNPGWMKDNLYQFEVIVPITETAQLYSHMLEQLNRISGYTGSVEIRNKKCLVLVRSGKGLNVRSKGGRPQSPAFTDQPLSLINRPINSLISSLNNTKKIGLLIIDETGITDNVDIQLSGSTEISILKKDLQIYGLDLLEVYRNLKVFVLKDKSLIIDLQ